jgi:iron complex transport system permease protein
LKKYGLYIFLLAILLLLVFIVDLWIGGTESLGFNELSLQNYIFRNIRLTKALTAVLCGISLPVAGQILQVLFRNPLAGPYVLGISSSSSFFVAIALMAFGNLFYAGNQILSKSALVLFSFAGSMLCTIIILSVAGKVKNNVFLLLIGLMMGQIFGALQSFVEYFSSNEGLRNFTLWGFGSIGNTDDKDVLLFSVFVFTLTGMMFLLKKPFQLFLLGENYANTLGIHYYRYRFLFLTVSSLLTAVATAFCGPIAFIGLSVPIMTRLLFSTANQTILLTGGMLLGAITMLLCDIIGHTFISGQIIPINIITTLIGSPFIIYLLFKNKSW